MVLLETKLQYAIGGKVPPVSSKKDQTGTKHSTAYALETMEYFKYVIVLSTSSGHSTVLRLCQTQVLSHLLKPRGARDIKN